MNSPHIRKAEQKDISNITDLLIRCAIDMQQQGMSHWLGVYDNEAVKQNLLTKQVYVLEKDEQILGCIAMGTEKASYYDDCWPEAPDAEIYITQLAVSPEKQGAGYGKQLMQFCLNRLQDKTVQLDAVDHYPALLKFYKNLGFQIIATGVGLGDKRHLFTYSANATT